MAEEKTKSFEEYDMFEPALADEIASMIRECLVYQGLITTK